MLRGDHLFCVVKCLVEDTESAIEIEAGQIAATLRRMDNGRQKHTVRVQYIAQPVKVLPLHHIVP